LNPNPPAGGPPGPSGTAKDALNLPSILLMAAGGLGVLNGIYSLINGGKNPMASQFANNPQAAEWAARAQSSGPIFAIVAILCSAFIIFGALKMKNLQSRNLAMAAAILACIPCLSPCCCVGIPFGIWALVVMNKPEVKGSFTA
jgi:hypothetical protein